MTQKYSFFRGGTSSRGHGNLSGPSNFSKGMLFLNSFEGVCLQEGGEKKKTALLFKRGRKFFEGGNLLHNQEKKRDALLKKFINPKKKWRGLLGTVLGKRAACVKSPQLDREEHKTKIKPILEKKEQKKEGGRMSIPRVYRGGKIPAKF